MIDKKLLIKEFDKVLGNDERPIVIFSSIWPFLKSLNSPNKETLDLILDSFMTSAKNRTVVMPSFTNGYTNGVCNLDKAKSQNGIFSERFREKYSTTRSRSAFFSFSASGKDSKQILSLNPRNVWGENSIYEWMELCDARMLMLGTHSTNCSYLHRLEWLNKEGIIYRENKIFKGYLQINNRLMENQEILFVRKENPEAINDFSHLKKYLIKGGMQSFKILGVPLFLYDVSLIMDSIMPIFEKDPLNALVNKKDFIGQ